MVNKPHKLTRDDLDRMGKALTDKRIESARAFPALAPAPGVDVDLDIMEAQYRAACVDFAEDAN